jgi:hypothetical protein
MWPPLVYYSNLFALVGTDFLLTVVIQGSQEFLVSNRWNPAFAATPMS